MPNQQQNKNDGKNQTIIILIQRFNITIITKSQKKTDEKPNIKQAITEVKTLPRIKTQKTKHHAQNHKKKINNGKPNIKQYHKKS